jgi:hypothetical protein
MIKIFKIKSHNKYNKYMIQLMLIQIINYVILELDLFKEIIL